MRLAAPVEQVVDGRLILLDTVAGVLLRMAVDRHANVVTVRIKLEDEHADARPAPVGIEGVSLHIPEPLVFHSLWYITAPEHIQFFIAEGPSEQGRCGFYGNPAEAH